MRIVESSNFDDPLYVESFVNLPLMSDHEANAFCCIINRFFTSGNSIKYYKVVPNDYVLQSGDPNE